LGKFARQFGIRTSLIPKAAAKLPRYIRGLWDYRRQNPDPPFTLGSGKLNPYLHDFDDDAGQASGHYFHQDLWAARHIFQRRPSYHVDIGSRVDGFVAHLLTFMNDVRVIDIRPMASDVEGLSFVQEDATSLAGVRDDSIDSLSSLHAAEHFGLGRYGDPIDPRADRKFMHTLRRVLSPGGRLYFSVPVGRPRLEFNAHRVYDPTTIVDAFPGLTLTSFSGCNDAGRFVPIARPADFTGAKFACGFYEFSKPV
jgi:SAM-dependent methyltransferase